VRARNVRKILTGIGAVIDASLRVGLENCEDEVNMSGEL